MKKKIDIPLIGSVGKTPFFTVMTLALIVVIGGIFAISNTEVKTEPTTPDITIDSITDVTQYNAHMMSEDIGWYYNQQYKITEDYTIWTPMTETFYLVVDEPLNYSVRKWGVVNIGGIEQFKVAEKGGKKIYEMKFTIHKVPQYGAISLEFESTIPNKRHPSFDYRLSMSIN